MGTMRFLLINSTPSDYWAKALRLALVSLGTLETTSRKRATTLLERSAYDVVFIDVTAVADFVEVVKELRQHWPALPIIVAATAVDWVPARAAFRAGATDYICKSHDQQELLSATNAVLEQNNLSAA